MEAVEINIAFSECVCVCASCVRYGRRQPAWQFLQMNSVNYVQHYVITFENTNFKFSLFV
jgi:hypothetical protein